MYGITYSARILSLQRPDIEHTVNFSDRELENKWWETKGAELFTLADFNDPKGFFLRTFWKSRVNHSEKLLALDNKIIIEKHKLLTRWMDLFVTLFTEPSTIVQHIVYNIEQRSSQPWISSCRDLDDVNKVISILRDGKSTGADRLPPEIIKRGDKRLNEVLYIIIKDEWENFEVLANWKDTQ